MWDDVTHLLVHCNYSVVVDFGMSHAVHAAIRLIFLPHGGTYIHSTAVDNGREAPTTQKECVQEPND